MLRLVKQGLVIVYVMVRHDWDFWIELIKTAALKHNVWQFVDPEINEYDRPKLVIPVKPTPEDVKDPKEGSVVTNFSELDAEEREEFRDLKEEYNTKKRMCKKQTEAPADLRFRIQETVHISNFTYTKGCSSVYEMLRNLADKFLPSDAHRKQELKLKWKNLPHSWETAYNELIHYKVKTLDDTEPIYDFLNALNTFDSYAHTKRVSLTDGVEIGFCQLLSNFRNYYRSISNIEQLQPQHGAFPTLQGHNEHGTPIVKGFGNSNNDIKQNFPNCPCSFRHRGAGIKFCYYLIPQAVPPGFNLIPDRVKKRPKKLVEQWRKEWKPKEVEQEVSKRPVTPPIVVMATVGQLSAFIATNYDV
ncbi:hypothetical protein OnM2_099048 [Erysiphe neolycopersici]|uniref:Uncharacterized protein n=1 Tax=Erysiphe neolycopersici TaxID=212602 RepID=A0A420HA29_9PEZI|nr:hypothetical protein OnM2_099048 [Erysiphe neolycopersici]